jgi:hypothetical protein
MTQPVAAEVAVVNKEEEEVPVDSGYEECVPQAKAESYDVFDSSDDDSVALLNCNGTCGIIGADKEIRDDMTMGDYTMAFKIEVMSISLAAVYAIFSFEPYRLSPARLVDLPFSEDVPERNIKEISIINKSNVKIDFPFTMVYLR